MRTHHTLLGTRLATFAALLLAASTGVAAAPVANVTLDPSQITLGDSAQLTITGTGDDLDAVRLPRVAGLEFRVVGQSRRIQFINGRTLATSSVIVRVTPQAAGIFSIPSITPGTEPLVLRVNPEGSPTGPLHGSPAVPGKGTSSDVAGLHMSPDGSAYLRLVLPKRDIFVGESIPVEIEIGLRNGFAQPNALPTLAGGDFTLNNLTRSPEQTPKTIDGKPFTVLTWHSVIVAVKPGKFSLTAQSPMTVRIRTRPQQDSMIDDLLGDPFLQNVFGATVTREITVTSPPTDLTVLELPTDGRPANFSGAVGAFKIDSDLSSAGAAVGDPLTLRLHVSGTGNFDRVDSPMHEHLDQWKTYPPKSAFKSTDALGMKGEKTFEQPIIAAQPGPQTLPGLTFSYFDPTARRYQTARAAPLPVTIAPSLADSSSSAPPALGTAGNPPVAAKANDGLRADHAESGGSVRSLLPLYFRPPFLALPATLALAFTAAWFARRRAQGTVRPGRGTSRSRDQLLMDLQAAAGAGDAAAFFTLAREALRPIADATPPAAVNDDVRDLSARADEAQYAGLTPAPADFERWLATLRRLLEEDRP